MTKNNQKNELLRVNLNLPASVVEKVRDYADSVGINYTSAYIVLLNRGLEQMKAMDNLPVLTSLLSEAIKIQSANLKQIEDADK